MEQARGRLDPLAGAADLGPARGLCRPRRRWARHRPVLVSGRCRDARPKLVAAHQQCLPGRPARRRRRAAALLRPQYPERLAGGRADPGRGPALGLAPAQPSRHRWHRLFDSKDRPAGGRAVHRLALRSRLSDAAAELLAGGAAAGRGVDRLLCRVGALLPRPQRRPPRRLAAGDGSPGRALSLTGELSAGPPAGRACLFRAARPGASRRAGAARSGRRSWWRWRRSCRSASPISSSPTRTSPCPTPGSCIRTFRASATTCSSTSTSPR